MRSSAAAAAGQSVRCGLKPMLLLFQFHKLVLLMGGKGVRSRQLYHKRIVMQVMGPVPLQVAFTPTTPLQVALH